MEGSEDLLPTGAVKKGDIVIVTFGGDDPRRWIVEEVVFSETGIKSFRLVPFDMPDDS